MSLVEEEKWLVVTRLADIGVRIVKRVNHNGYVVTCFTREAITNHGRSRPNQRMNDSSRLIQYSSHVSTLLFQIDSSRTHTMIRRAEVLIEHSIVNAAQHVGLFRYTRNLISPLSPLAYDRCLRWQSPSHLLTFSILSRAFATVTLWQLRQY